MAPSLALGIYPISPAQAAVTAILAVGMTLVIVSANIDLSVGYGAGLLGAIAAIVHVRWGQPIPVTLFIVICIGILMGLMQGYLVAYQRIPAFIVTLGGFLGYRGLMLAFTKGETILLPDNWLKAIGNAYLSPTLGWGLMVIGIGISGYRFYRQRVARLQYGNPGANVSVDVPIENRCHIGTHRRVHHRDEYPQRGPISSLHSFRISIYLSFYRQPHPFRTLRLCGRW